MRITATSAPITRVTPLRASHGVRELRPSVVSRASCFGVSVMRRAYPKEECLLTA
jgi:hypothetical protein